MRKFVIASVSVYVAGMMSMLGLLSNWFRYGLSLEAMLVSAVIVGGGVAVLVVASVAFKRPCRATIVVLCVAELGSAACAGALHRNAFGTWTPPLQLHHIEASGYATLETRGQLLRYAVELRDPFSSVHEEFLVINRRGDELRIRLPIFAEIPGGYFAATQPQDWVVLLPTDDKNVFIAEIGSSLSEKRFRVDLTSRAVTVLPKTR